MPNPTFQAIISAVNESATAFKAVRTDLGAVKKEADLARESLVKLDRPNALANLRTSTQALTGHFGELNGKIGETHGFLKGLFPAIAAFGALGSVAGLFGLVGKVADARVEFTMMADRIGISTRELGQFMFAAKMTHVPAEALEGGLIKLNRAMGDAAIGKNKMAAAILQRLGFNLKDIKSGAVTAADVLPRLASSFGRTENAAIKTAVAQALLGKGGAALIPMLNQGAEAWTEYAKEAAKFRYAFTPEDNRNLEEYEHSTIRLNTAVQGITNAIAAGLAPVLSPLNNQMAEWIAANREWIATGITKAVKELSDWVAAQDWSRIISDAGSLAQTIGGIANAAGGLAPILEGLVIIKLASWAYGVGAGFMAMAAGLDAIAGTTVFATLGAAGLAALAAAAGTAATANALGRIRYGTMLDDLKEAREHPERFQYIPPELYGPPVPNALPEPPAFVAPPEPLGPVHFVRPPAAELSRTPIILNLPKNEPLILRPPALSPPASPSAPTVPSAPLVWPETFPSPGAAGAQPLSIFPSPYAPDLRSRQAGPPQAAPGVDGQLKIIVELPNLPPDSRVTTERTGNVPEPAVDVGRSDPMSPF